MKSGLFEEEDDGERWELSLRPDEPLARLRGLEMSQCATDAGVARSCLKGRLEGQRAPPLQ